MQGRVVQINVSPGGIPKRPIPFGVITPLGLEGDGHHHPQIHGGPRQAVLLIASEVIEELKAKGYPIESGSLGENITMQGIDPAQLRLDQILRVGTAVVQLTKVRVPCGTLDVCGRGIQAELYDGQVKAGDPSSPNWGKSGFYARVVEPGVVATGDIISVEATFA